jgi:ABC-type phosphate transport system substrate-binding protein
MSRTLGAPRWASGAVLAGAIALVLTALAAVGLSSQANAAFTTGKCAGENIIGRGASFARDAHKIFNDKFKLVFCVGTPGAGTINVTYEASGSGAGRQSMKVRDGAPRFGMTDEPPSPTEINEMNSGVTVVGGSNVIDSDPTNDGKIHLVPAAVGAVAPLVNFPDNCDVGLLDSASRTPEEMSGGGTPFPLGLVRVRFTKDEFEKIWAKEATHDNWVEVFPELNTDADCNKPIIRIVRFDDSGTSFAFKDNLGTINAARDWLGAFAATSPKKTREWPGATFGDRDDCGDNDGVPKTSDPDGPGAPGLAGDTDQLTSACFNGNQGIVDKLIATDGSVGYSDISTARNNVAQSLAIKPRLTAGDPFDNDIYWTQIPSGPGAGTFQEPTADAKGFRTDGTPGSNCQAAQFVNKAGGGLPSTLQDWSKVSGVNSAGAFAICTLTYGLVFDDNADVWKNTSAEETKARTVKDYWENILSIPAQSALFDKDYSPLPAQILDIAETAIASVDWDKGVGGGGGEENDKDEGGKKDGGTTPPPPPGKPSNRFSLLRKSISSKTGGATIAVKLPGAGKLELIATAKNGKKTINVARAVLNAGKQGTFNVPLRPSGAAMKALRKKSRLPVKLALTFTPTGGDANETTSTVVLKLKKPAKRN